VNGTHPPIPALHLPTFDQPTTHRCSRSGHAHGCHACWLLLSFEAHTAAQVHTARVHAHNQDGRGPNQRSQGARPSLGGRIPITLLPPGADQHPTATHHISCTLGCQGTRSKPWVRHTTGYNRVAEAPMLNPWACSAYPAHWQPHYHHHQQQQQQLCTSSGTEGWAAAAAAGARCPQWIEGGAGCAAGQAQHSTTSQAMAGAQQGCAALLR
jgi:hypothetical protein